jgi:hypothetical protein
MGVVVQQLRRPAPEEGRSPAQHDSQSAEIESLIGSPGQLFDPALNIAEYGQVLLVLLSRFG